MTRTEDSLRTSARGLTVDVIVPIRRDVIAATPLERLGLATDRGDRTVFLAQDLDTHAPAVVDAYLACVTKRCAIRFGLEIAVDGTSITDLWTSCGCYFGGWFEVALLVLTKPPTEPIPIFLDSSESFWFRRAGTQVAMRRWERGGETTVGIDEFSRVMTAAAQTCVRFADAAVAALARAPVSERTPLVRDELARCSAGARTFLA